MVTTRSGRGLSLAEMRSAHASKQSLKPSYPCTVFTRLPSFTIHEDSADAAAPDAQDPLPANKPDSSVPIFIKNAPASTVLSENVNTINQALLPACAPASVPLVKEIALSEAEKMMSGAPEGVLYEAKVEEEDAALPPFPSPEEGRALLAQALGAAERGSVWIALFEALSLARRALRHCPGQLGQEEREGVARVVSLSLSSLRSAVVRNALHCARALLSLQPPLSDTQTETLLGALLGKLTSAGPRFMQELSLSVCLQAAASSFPRLFLPLACPYLAHRSGEVARRAAQLIIASLSQRLEGQGGGAGGERGEERGEESQTEALERDEALFLFHYAAECALRGSGPPLQRARELARRLRGGWREGWEEEYRREYAIGEEKLRQIERALQLS